MEKIIKVSQSDYKLLNKLSRETFLETFLKDNKEKDIYDYIEKNLNEVVLKQELCNVDSMFYFIFKQEELAGFIKLNINESQTEQIATNAIEIERIYLKKEFQGCGLGQLLINFAINKSNMLKKDFLWLGVWEKNYQAQKFYKKIGFEKCDEHIFYMGDDPQTDYILKLDLKK